jgi:hypothetical protein
MSARISFGARSSGISRRCRPRRGAGAATWPEPASTAPRAAPRASCSRPTLLPLGPEPFDPPTWAQCTVHPDHHIQFQRALYSVPTRYIGAEVDVRGDSRLVRIYLGGELIKVHPPPPGGRSTDYTDYPTEQTPYAMRAPDACIRHAAEVGPAVGQFVTVLLSGTFPWARLRQAQKLLRLAERYGAARVNAACARALAFDLIEVRRVEAIVRTALEHEPPASERGTVVPLPARFARPPRSFAHHPEPREEE